MSYDLAVFDPSAAPTSRAEFVEWFKQQTEWSEPHDDNDPETPAAPLRAWFHDMIATYPPIVVPLHDENDIASGRHAYVNEGKVRFDPMRIPAAPREQLDQSWGKSVPIHLIHQRGFAKRQSVVNKRTRVTPSCVQAALRVL